MKILSKAPGLVFAATMVAALAGTALVGAPIAAADPNDWVPYCTAGQIPEPGECLPAPNSVYIDDAPGANPEIPLGLNPELVPAI